MYSQRNETGIWEVLKIKIFFAAQSWRAEFLRFFLKLFLWILRFGGDISASFLKKRKKVKVLLIWLSITTKKSQNLQEEMRNCK